MIEILTKSGFSKFDGVRRTWSNQVKQIYFTDKSSIIATEDHRFFRDGIEVFVRDLNPGDIIEPDKTISSIEEAEPQYVYDILETSDHTFIANDVVSHNCQFLGSSGTLINGATLKLMEHSKPIYQSDKGLYVYENAIPGHIYAMIVDSSQGKGLDYSALSVIDITEFPYRQVAAFRSNTIGHYDYSTMIFTLAKQYNNPQILIELNCPTGAIVAEDLFWRHEYENILMTQGAGRLGKKISSGYGGGNIDRGVYTTASVKSMGCAMLKILIEQNQLILHDQNTILELMTFSKKGNSYEAEEGNHDDLVMGLVLFGWLSIQEYFKEMTNSEIQEKLREETDDDIDEFVGGAMLVNNGVNEHHEVEYY